MAGTALFLIRFWKIGIRRVHILGVSAFFKLALAGYMARNFFDDVTSDGTSWKMAAQYNNYLDPKNLKRQNVTDAKNVNTGVRINCKCSVCKNRNFDDFRELPYPKRRVSLAAHNYFAIREACKMFYENASSLERFEQHLLKQSGEKQNIDELVYVLSVIEKYKDQKIEYLSEVLLQGLCH